MRYAMIVLLVAAGSGCGEESTTPTVEVLDVAPQMLDPSDDALDDLTIRVAYTDGDGDLGEGVAEVHDCRADGVVVVLEIPPIASELAVGEGVPIEGELELVVADVGDIAADDVPSPVCTTAGLAVPAAGEVAFCVTLTDAADHTSEPSCTAPIALVAP